MPTWSVGSRDLCQPRTEADGKPVTESNLSLRAPAQRAACAAVGPIPTRTLAAQYYSRDFTVSFRSCLASSRSGSVCGYAK
jgi:hypothetical protein